MNQIKEVIKQTLDDFFPSNGKDEYDDQFYLNKIDEEDKELLTTALSESIERVVLNESKN